MGFSTSRLYNDRLYKFIILFFLLLPLTLLIIAVSLHNLYSFNAADINQPGTAITGSAHFGAFYGCADIDGTDLASGGTFSIHQCHSIRSDCKVAFKVSTSAGEFEVDEELGPNWNCSQYNAFRAFLVISIITVGFALITAMLSLLYFTHSRLLMALTVTFTSLAILSTVISWGLVADHWKTVNDGTDWFKRGPAFGLVVTAFVLMVVALIVYIPVWRIESVGYSKHGSSGNSSSSNDGGSAAVRGKGMELQESTAAADDTVVETA